MSMLLPEEAFPAPPFTDEELEEYLNPPLVDPDYPAGGHVLVRDTRPSKWSITDNSTAEWAMRRLAHAEANLRARRDEAAEFKRQIDNWLAGQVGPLERRRAFFEQHLTEYARWQRETNDAKTLKLPSGEVTSRKVSTAIKIPDEAREPYTLWAARNLPDTIKAKWSPVMDEVKKRVTWRTVVVPPHSDGLHGRLFDVDDHLLAAHASIPIETIEKNLEQVDIEGLLNEDYREETRVVAMDDDGAWWLVPHVELVPEHVSFTVKPALP